LSTFKRNAKIFGGYKKEELFGGKSHRKNILEASSIYRDSVTRFERPESDMKRKPFDKKCGA
jgi:hypothetical protein